MFFGRWLCSLAAMPKKCPKDGCGKWSSPGNKEGFCGAHEKEAKTAAANADGPNWQCLIQLGEEPCGAMNAGKHKVCMSCGKKREADTSKDV
eukprot:g1309.t1